MSSKIKILLLVILLGLALLFFMSDENSEETKVDIKKEKITISPKEVIKEKNSTKILHYKDIVKEPKPMQTVMERIIERQELEQLDKDSEALIKEADAFIEENNLHVPIIVDADKIEEHQKKLDELGQKLDKLSE